MVLRLCYHENVPKIAIFFEKSSWGGRRIMSKATKRSFFGLLIALIALFACICGVACNNKPEAETSYTVVYDSRGGASVKNGTYTPGKLFSLPTPEAGSSADMYGYSFIGWFYDEDCTKPVDRKNIDIGYAVKGTLTFYAGWSNKHEIVFDTKTSEYFDPMIVSYGDTVRFSSLPVPQGRVVGEITCEFIGWVNASTGNLITSDFTMDVQDMYFTASYNTGVNERFYLTDDGYYVPTGSESATTQSRIFDYTLNDGEVYSVEMVLPADWSTYTGDSGPVFAAKQFNESGTTFNGDYYITMFVSAGMSDHTCDGALEFWIPSPAVACVGRYKVDGVLKGTPYAEKYLAYRESGKEESFTFTFRRVDNSDNSITWYVGVDGIEYFELTTGKKVIPNSTDVAQYDIAIPAAFAGEDTEGGVCSIVGLRAKTKGFKYGKISVEKADKVICLFNAGAGEMEGETLREYAYGEEIALPVPVQNGFEFMGWYYTDTTGNEVKLEDGAAFEKNVWKLNLTAKYKRANAKPYTVNFDTGVDGYAPNAVVGWYEGNTLPAPTGLKYTLIVFSGKWYYDEARTREVNLNAVDPANADVQNPDTDEQSFTLYAGFEQVSFLEGKGTQAEPFLIKTADDLIRLAQVVNGGEAFTGKYFAVKADIALGDEWTPIGTDKVSFAGILDGENHKITGVVISGTGELGFFVGLTDATVKNLDITASVTVGSSTKFGVGILAGWIVGNTTIENVTTRGSVNSGEGCVGGIAGYSKLASGKTTIIKNCVNYAAINSTATGNSLVGGILGATFENVNVIEGCRNYGSVSSGGAFNGGIVGLIRKHADSTVENCYDYGDVTGVSSVGGIAGGNRGNVVNCYVLNTATVQGTAASGLPKVGYRTSISAVSAPGYIIGQQNDDNGGKEPVGCKLFKVVDGEAVFIEPTVTIVFDAGADVTDPENKVLELGTAIGTLPAPEKAGFRLAGWKMNDTEITGETQFDEEYEGKTVTLTAVWIEQITITFNTNGGTLPAGVQNSAVIDKNGTLSELPVPTKSGQTFVGWFDGSSQAALADTYAEDTELLAHWEEAAEYSNITFMPDGGAIAATEGITITNGVGSKQIESGTAIGTLPEASKNGYRFIGWATPDGTIVTAATEVSQANVTLTAQWALQTVITFVTAGGTLTGDATKSIDAGTALGAFPAVVAPAGDELKGWFDEAGNAVTETTRFAETETAVTLTAKFGWDGATASESLSGTGTEESPYLIASGADLKYFASNVTAGFYKLTEDIDLNDKAWTPIATFGGTIDGDGHKITGLNVNATTAIAALFSQLNGATVKNLDVTGTVVSTANQVAILAGKISGAALVENVVTRGTVSGKTSEVAGMVGYINCGNATLTVTIKDCRNYANVTTTATGTACTGGIVGSCDQVKIIITGCKNYGNIQNGGNFVGGIIGLARKAAGSQITGCYNFGKITSTTNSKSASGIAGCLRVDCEDCWNAGTVSVGTSITGNQHISGDVNNGGFFKNCGTCDENGENKTPIADFAS